MRKWFDKDGNRMQCPIPECEGLIYSSGYCNAHLAKMKYVPTPRRRSTRDENGNPKLCEFSGCVNYQSCKGLCVSHYNQIKYKGQMTPIGKVIPCPIYGCENLMGNGASVCKKHAQFMWRYTINLQDALKMHQPENLVCGNGECGSTENLHLDHDHSCCPPGKYGTGHKIACGFCNRGWLCASCNKALGMLQENPRRIQGLLDYLSSNGRG